MTLSRLAAGNDLVLMDLRGFSPSNQGCAFELHQLVDLVPLSKVVLILDRTTDVPFLREVLAAAWATISDRSPNRCSASARVVAFQLRRDDSKGARLLLAGLAEALADDVAGPEALTSRPHPTMGPLHPHGPLPAVGAGEHPLPVSPLPRAGEGPGVRASGRG